MTRPGEPVLVLQKGADGVASIVRDGRYVNRELRGDSVVHLVVLACVADGGATGELVVVPDGGYAVVTEATQIPDNTVKLNPKFEWRKF